MLPSSARAHWATCASSSSPWSGSHCLPVSSHFSLAMHALLPFADWLLCHRPGVGRRQVVAYNRRTGQGPAEMHFLTKKHLDRRALLKGVGAAIALSALAAIFPA